MVGILRWVVELGRVDIYYETAILSHYLVCPCEGHLEALYHIFVYLKSHQRFNLVFNPKGISLDQTAFASVKPSNWRDFYGDIAEELPPNMPEPLGHAMDITCFVDSDHAGNVVTRRSHTGILIFVQNAPVIWYSKKQNTVESSSFRSKIRGITHSTGYVSGPMLQVADVRGARARASSHALRQPRGCEEHHYPRICTLQMA